MNLFIRFLCFILCAVSLQAFALDPVPSPYQYKLSGQVSAFFPESSRFQRIYGDCLPVYGIEFSSQFSSSWDYWVGLDLYHRSSRMYEDCCHSKITTLYTSSGLNYVFHFLPKFDLKLGLGPVLGVVILDNHSWCKKETSTAFIAGVLFKIAGQWNLNPHVFFKLFADYSYQCAFFKNYVNIGGTKIGGGFGWKF